MKIIKGLLLIIIALGFVKIAAAQDIIVKKDGTTIESKVTKITSMEVEYKKWSNIDGPVYTIDKEEVAQIKYQNGDIEDYTIVATPKNFMKRVGRTLVLDGHTLSDEEVLALVGEENYNTYLSARNQISNGDWNAFLFGGAFIGAVYFFFEGMTVNNEFHVLIGAGLGILADVGLIALIINKSAGKGRMSWVADEYNRQHGTYKLSLAPSVIKTKTPQFNDNYGVGLTLSLKF